MNAFLKIMKAGSFIIIAEVKLRSPSSGVLGTMDDFKPRIRAYETGGANALSLVVEKMRFGGDISMISKARKVTKLPILAKDFVKDISQINNFNDAGAEAVLLITKFLEKNTLQKLVAHTMKLKMEPIVEIHNKEELQKALTTNARIIAVNARDVNTFSIDVDRACAIIRTIPKDRIILGFSGIKSEKEVDKYKKAGARGILMGTVLMRSKNPEKILTTFRPL